MRLRTYTVIDRDWFSEFSNWGMDDSKDIRTEVPRGSSLDEDMDLGTQVARSGRGQDIQGITNRTLFCRSMLLQCTKIPMGILVMSICRHGLTTSMYTLMVVRPSIFLG